MSQQDKERIEAEKEALEELKLRIRSGVKAGGGAFPPHMLMYGMMLPPQDS